MSSTSASTLSCSCCRRCDTHDCLALWWCARRSMMRSAGTNENTIRLVKASITLPKYNFAASVGVNVCQDPPTLAVELRETSGTLDFDGFKRSFSGDEVRLQVPCTCTIVC
jgi:hypothetical protein